MRQYLSDFLGDERGCVPAMEWVFVASILTLGAMAVLALSHQAEPTDRAAEYHSWTIPQPSKPERKTSNIEPPTSNVE